MGVENDEFAQTGPELGLPDADPPIDSLLECHGLGLRRVGMLTE